MRKKLEELVNSIFNSITINDEEYKLIVRFDKDIEGYYISKSGRVFSAKNNRFRKFSVDRSKRTGRVEALKFSVSIPADLFEDYKYSKRSKNSKFVNIPLRVHKAVMDTWKPIDENPPESLVETWNQVITPDMVGKPRITPEWKQWVKDTVIIDHIDDDPTNNNLNNLRYSIPKDNSSHRKKQQMNGELK